MARKVSVVLLVLLSLFLLGTIVVLSTTKAYLRIDDWAYLTEDEVPWQPAVPHNRSEEIVPRILHQTWKTEVLPEKWAGPSQECRDLMPDYEYMLWTDAMSRELIADHYSWFLPTFDGYKYNIQRADAIRYFVLHHFGGVYMDLDIGCVRPVDPLLKFQVILPKTIPVGVSNDLMTSTKGHPFMEQVIRGLITFDINYALNYPTVMFSTGPMFMSAQYGLYTASHPPTSQNPGGDVRILPKSLYGKNAKEGEAPHAFFIHFYGSSWHSDDAWLWTFLGVWGMRLMYVAIIVAIVLGIRMYWLKGKKGSGRTRRFLLGRYEVILPRFYYDRDSQSAHIDVGPFSVSVPSHSREGSGSSAGSALSPTSSEPASPTMLPLSLEVSPASPTLSTSSSSSESNAVTDAIKRAGSWVVDALSGRQGANSYPYERVRRDSNAGRSRRRRSRGILFFLPTIFTPSRGQDPVDGISLPPVHESSAAGSRARTPLRKDEEAAMEAASLMATGRLDAPGERSTPTASRRSSFSATTPVTTTTSPPPPPYASSRSRNSSWHE